MIYATLIEIAITLALTLWSFRMKSAKRWVYAAILLASVLFFAFTYGKWEFQTFRHGSGFHRLVMEEATQSGVPFTESIKEGGVSHLKIMGWGADQAEVYVKDGAGNKWLFHFVRSEDGTWTTYDGREWQVEMIYSQYGGNGNQRFWWY
jgi:hypothetical protein